MSFDPNNIGLRNGNIFGFPYTEEEAEIFIIPVAFDATASFGKGTSKGPEAILEASTQLDFYSHHTKNAWQTKVFMTPISKELGKVNDDLVQKSLEYFDFLENGGQLETSPAFQIFVKEMNEAQTHLKAGLKEKVKNLIKDGKKFIVLGGEHSVPLGAMEAVSEIYSDFGILQIDAHADLRVAYEGFDQSHASIMDNALKLPSLSKLVQVGIRDICDEEVNRIKYDERIDTYYDWNISKSKFTGGNWDKITDDIMRRLPKNVYVSFDIDGLKPELCPNTGTPVPGGLEFNEATYLLQKLKESGKNIVGADLCEVGGQDANSIDANVGARILWELALLF
ncbi:MAG: agmatinase family protein [Crocinitomicaceae bacterium]